MILIQHSTILCGASPVALHSLIDPGATHTQAIDKTRKGIFAWGLVQKYQLEVYLENWTERC